MVTLDKLREDMRNKYAIDKEIRQVEVMADTIDDTYTWVLTFTLKIIPMMRLRNLSGRHLKSTDITVLV